MGRVEMKRGLYFGLALLAFGNATAEPRNPLEALRLPDLVVTRERPIFTPSRRAHLSLPSDDGQVPPILPLGEDKVASFDPPPLDLIGTVVGEGLSYALIRNRGTAIVVRVRPGDEADGWQVRMIHVRSILLQREGHENALELHNAQ
jgi:general secretion pathway protein N